MTDEQIKQNAERYYDKLDSITIEVKNEPNSIVEAYITGAHSRDEEVSKLEKALYNVNWGYHQLCNKLYELSCSWISVEDNLPDHHTPVYAKNNKRTWFFALRTDNRVRPWYDIVGRHPEKVTHWKPIQKPILKKG